MQGGLACQPVQVHILTTPFRQSTHLAHDVVLVGVKGDVFGLASLGLQHHRSFVCSSLVVLELYLDSACRPGHQAHERLLSWAWDMGSDQRADQPQHPKLFTVNLAPHQHSTDQPQQHATNDPPWQTCYSLSPVPNRSVRVCAASNRR